MFFTVLFGAVQIFVGVSRIFVTWCYVNGVCPFLYVFAFLGLLLFRGYRKTCWMGLRCIGRSPIQRRYQAMREEIRWEFAFPAAGEEEVATSKQILLSKREALGSLVTLGRLMVPFCATGVEKEGPAEIKIASW